MHTRFRRARKSMNLTQKQVADRINVNHTTYNRYESGMIEPDIERLRMLADIFDVTVDHLLMHEAPECEEQVPLVFKEEFIEKYQQLDIRGKAAVDGTLEREYAFVKLEKS